MLQFQHIGFHRGEKERGRKETAERPFLTGNVHVARRTTPQVNACLFLGERLSKSWFLQTMLLDKGKENC